MTQVHPALAGLGSGRCLVIGEVAMSHDGSSASRTPSSTRLPQPAPTR